jgi:hypothetical protein
MNRKVLGIEQRARIEGHLAELEGFGTPESSSIQD